MRPIWIEKYNGESGIAQLRSSFKKNWRHYLQEATGLAIFMISACFFSSLLEAKGSSLHRAIPSGSLRTAIMGILMGLTAIFIFYSPVTSRSGSHINPAVTLTFLRIGKMCRWDSLFYIIFQFIGGTIAVFVMQFLLGRQLTDPPVRFAVTVPGTGGIWPALVTEFTISFITIIMVLFTSFNAKLKRYTRIVSGCLVCSWVIIAGPVSGFGMNPARSFSSALAANT